MNNRQCAADFFLVLALCSCLPLTQLLFANRQSRILILPVYSDCNADNRTPVNRSERRHVVCLYYLCVPTRMVSVMSDRILVGYTLWDRGQPQPEHQIELSANSEERFIIAESDRVDMSDIRQHQPIMSIRKAEPGLCKFWSMNTNRVNFRSLKCMGVITPKSAI